MSLEVFYLSDIQNAILAAEQAMTATAEAHAHDQPSAMAQAFASGYQTGYRAALTTLALLFGVVNTGSKESSLAQHTSLVAHRRLPPRGGDRVWDGSDLVSEDEG